MKKNFCILFLFAALNSFAQDSSAIKQGDIYRKWPGWRMNGKFLKGKEFKQEIYKVPAAIPYYKKANSNLNLSFLALAGMATFALLGKEGHDIGSSDFGKQKNGF